MQTEYLHTFSGSAESQGSAMERAKFTPYVVSGCIATLSAPWCDDILGTFRFPSGDSGRAFAM